MDRESYRKELEFKLSGGIIELELTEAQLDIILDNAFRETQRYIDTTRFATIPYSKCINLKGCGVSTVTAVYRTSQNGMTSGGAGNMTDPMYAAQWQILSGAGGMTNMQNWTLNLAAWNTLSQIRNTLSTDLAFIYDKHDENLYINVSQDVPQYITIEYVPLYKDISEVTSDYWIDIIMRFAVALGKIALGRARTRFSQSNALWAQDGERLLEEGNTALTELRETLRVNSNLYYPID